MINMYVNCHQQKKKKSFKKINNKEITYFATRLLIIKIDNKNFLKARI